MQPPIHHRQRQGHLKADDEQESNIRQMLMQLRIGHAKHSVYEQETRCAVRKGHLMLAVVHMMHAQLPIRVLPRQEQVWARLRGRQELGPCPCRGGCRGCVQLQGAVMAVEVSHRPSCSAHTCRYTCTEPPAVSLTQDGLQLNGVDAQAYTAAFCSQPGAGMNCWENTGIQAGPSLW